MAETNARLSDESVVLQVLGLLYLIVIPVPCRAVPCRAVPNPNSVPYVVDYSGSLRTALSKPYCT
jgi:hypothetical protein